MAISLSLSLSLSDSWADVVEPREQSLGMLLASAGQLSGDGQLRELIAERRERQGGTGPIWYFQSALVAALGLGQGEEAVVTTSPAVLTWLQLRFGGRIASVVIPTDWLGAEAQALPPAPERVSLMVEAAVSGAGARERA
ncbi:MAG: hypothetical protein VKM34_08820 [Cyanobacteriota bacterium]|nr:hypothetical protein [Cyanobacteriota bacterium]